METIIEELFIGLDENKKINTLMKLIDRSSPFERNMCAMYLNLKGLSNCNLNWLGATDPPYNPIIRLMSRLLNLF